MKISQRDVYSVLGIYIVIGLIWVAYELIFVGERIPRLRDDFIAFGSSLVIYGVWKMWNRRNTVLSEVKDNKNKKDRG